MKQSAKNKEKIQSVLESQKWTFAKTMKSIPHEWVHAKTYHGHGISMVAIAKYIQDYGYTEYFYGKPYKYINIGDYKYWTMDFPIENTDLINRSRLESK